MSSRVGLLLFVGLSVGVTPVDGVAAPASSPAVPAAPAKAKAPAAKAPAPPAKAPAAKAPGKPGKATAPAAPAKDAEPTPGTDATAGQEVEMTEDAPPTDMEGTNENPDAPREFDAPDPVAAPVRVRRTGYPVEEVVRPITLPRFVTEVALDTRSTFSPFINGSALRARFGINSKAQVGLVYNIGGIYDDGGGKTAFNTGKAVALQGTYTIRNWIAAQFSAPMYLEPYAASLTLGVPLKFRFDDRFALLAGEDFIDIRLSKFVPSLINEAENEVNVANTDNNTVTSKGNFRFAGGGIFQYKKNVAFTGRIAVTLINFETIDLGYLLKVGAQWSARKSFDLSATIGFDDLEIADESFGFQLGAAFRI